MTRERCKELLPILQAYADGKVIQWKSTTNQNWKEAELEDLFEYPNLTFRIKPSPTLRPWKPEEVPVGAQIHYKLNLPHQKRALILSVNDTHVYVLDNQYKLEILSTEFEHSLDNGKTWLPCGVQEDS